MFSFKLENNHITAFNLVGERIAWKELTSNLWHPYHVKFRQHWDDLFLALSSAYYSLLLCQLISEKCG